MWIIIEFLLQALAVCWLWSFMPSRWWFYSWLLLPPLRALLALGLGDGPVEALALYRHWLQLFSYCFLMLLAVAHRRLLAQSPLALWRQPLQLRTFMDDLQADALMQATEERRRRDPHGSIILWRLFLHFTTFPPFIFLNRWLPGQLLGLIAALLSLLWLLPLLRWRLREKRLKRVPRRWWLVPLSFGLLLALMNLTIGLMAAAVLAVALLLADRPRK